MTINEADHVSEDRDTKPTCRERMWEGRAGDRRLRLCGNELEPALICGHDHCPTHNPELHSDLGVCGSLECARKQANELMRVRWKTHMLEMGLAKKLAESRGNAEKSAQLNGQNHPMTRELMSQAFMLAWVIETMAGR